MSNVDNLFIVKQYILSCMGAEKTLHFDMLLSEKIK